MSTPFVIVDQGNLTIRTVDSSGVINTPSLTSTDPIWNSFGGWADPWGAATDSAGNLYVCDTGANSVVYKITPSFVLTRVAGDGGIGFSGVPGPALNARFSSGNSNYLACDPAGNLYITYNGGVVILCVNMQLTTQVILGVTIPPGNIAIVAGVHNLLTYGGDGGPATSAGIPSPNGIAVNAAGDLYICSTGIDPSQLGARIRKVDHATGIISTVAGTGATTWSGDGGPATSATLAQATGVCVDTNGNFYISGSNSGPEAAVRVVNTQTIAQTILNVLVLPGTIQTVAGGASHGFSGDGGQATSALLGLGSVGANPGLWSSKVDTNGDLYIVDNGNNRIRKVDHATGIITTIVDNTGVAGYTGDGGPALVATIARFGNFTEDMAFWPNTPPTTGNIVVHKITVPIASPQIFTFRPSYGLPFNLTDGQSKDSGPLAPGTYSVLEDPVAGWTTTTSSDPTAIVVTAGATTNITFTNVQNPPVARPCAPLDGTGTPVNGVYVADLSLFIIPASALYKNLSPNSELTFSESSLQGHKEIVIDFNGSNGLWTRDLGTIFTWDLRAKTVLYFWQPSIIPMNDDIYYRIAFHSLTSSLGMTGYAHAREMNLAHISTADLTLTLEFDDWPTIVLTVPNSGGQQLKTKVTLPVNKWKLIQVIVSSTVPFKLYGSDLELKCRQWGSTGPYQVLKPVVT